MNARSAGNCFVEISLPVFFPSSPAFFIADTPDNSSAHKIHPHRGTPSAPQSHPTPARPYSSLAAYSAQSVARRHRDNPMPGSAAAPRAAPIVPLANCALAPFPPPSPPPHDPYTWKPRKYFLRAPAVPGDLRRCAPHACSKYVRPALHPHSGRAQCSITSQSKPHWPLPIAAPNRTPRHAPLSVAAAPTSIHAVEARPHGRHLAAPRPVAVPHGGLQPVAGFPALAPMRDRSRPAPIRTTSRTMSGTRSRRSLPGADDSSVSLLSSFFSCAAFSHYRRSGIMLALCARNKLQASLRVGPSLL